MGIYGRNGMPAFPSLLPPFSTARDNGASMINEQGIDCRGTMLIAMDEYLDNADQWVDLDHPLSFRGFLNRKFYDLVDERLAPKMENRVVPDPEDPGAVGRLIAERGGVDAVFGGIGINGHIAFNEPEEDISPQDFALLPTRTLEITPHTRTINAHTVGGEIGIIPRRAITVGMKEILGARRLRFFCNRPWQRAVVRPSSSTALSARRACTPARRSPPTRR